MRSIPLALVFSLFAVGSISAQGIVRPFTPVAPVVPFRPGVGGFGGGVLPIQPGFGVVGGGLGIRTPNFGLGFGGANVFPLVNSFPLYYGGFGGFGGFDPNGFAPTAPSVGVPAPAPVIPNLQTSREPDWLALSLVERPAQVTIQLPADGEVFLDGKTVDGSGTTRMITSAPIKPGKSQTLRLRMTWTKEGVAYEAERTLEVGPGETTKLVIFAGTPIK